MSEVSSTGLVSYKKIMNITNYVNGTATIDTYWDHPTGKETFKLPIEMKELLNTYFTDPAFFLKEFQKRAFTIIIDGAPIRPMVEKRVQRS